MKEFLEFILKEISTKPESIEIEETQDDGLYVYKIHAADEDMGLIIGKEGRTIKSIRNMAKAKAIKDNIRISIILEDNLPRKNDEV